MRLPFALALMLATAAPAAAQDREIDRHAARLEAWAAPLAEQLMAALPDPIDGLAEFAPWDDEFREPPGWGCPISCLQLTPIRVQRAYVVAEPELEARVAANDEKALANAIKITASPSDEKLHAAQRAMADMDKTLKDSVRRIVIEVLVNVGPPERRGSEKAPAPAGTVHGYPVQRFAYSDTSYEPTPEGVRLALRIGPESFKPTRVNDVSEMKTEARAATISVSLTSRTATVKTDEALARKHLERVDVAAIAKLLKP